jgi:recombination associated protein RdgC
LQSLAFTPCLPTLPMTQGWVSPEQDDDATLVHSIADVWRICLQFEEKVLPPKVVRQALHEQIQHIEKTEGRRVRQKEKYALKDDIIHTLLPRAFSQLTRIDAYIDREHGYLVIDSTHEKKRAAFIECLQKAIGGIELRTPSIKNLMPITTHWLTHNSYPDFIHIEQQGVFQSPDQQNRIVRCQHQDLFARSIQSLVQEGYQVKQLALVWREQVNFTLHEDLSLRQIRFADELTQAAKDSEISGDEQTLDVDYLLMTRTLSVLLKELVLHPLNTPLNSGYYTPH